MYLYLQNFVLLAQVVELVDTTVLEAVASRCKSSSLFLGTIHMFTVYTISSTIKNYIYVGMTENIDRRFFEHQQGYSFATKPYRPFEILFTEECEDSISAREREKYWKS